LGAELLFWPALFAYGEASLAFAREARRPGVAGRLAIWGVRLGWLAQTGLLLLQAVRAEGFPWGGWAGALNLFAWLVVGAYLIWGCRPSFRLLGLAVMPIAAALLLVAYAGGGIREAGGRTDALLALHVALMLAGFAGFTLAAALSTLYLWHERRLKRRGATIFRLRVPALQVLDRLGARTVAVSLLVLTLGIALGGVSLALDGGRFDAAMGGALAVWLGYGGFLLLRRRTALHGRRSARASLVVFVAVVVVIPLTHFAS